NPVAAFEENYGLVLVEPDPLGLPDVRRAEFQRLAVSELERPAAGPMRMKEGDVGVRSGDPHGNPRVPESLALEGPVMVVGLGIGQRAALESQRCDDVVARPQFVV